MSWLDTLRPASFRNVPFHVDTIDVSAGDHTVLREYPFQDLPTVFRMGEAAEEIKISAYVIGPDYTQQREALRAVLTGQGELVHPTAGTMRVFVVGKYTIKENPTAEGGMARFDLTFVRAEARRTPAGVVSTPAAADAAAEVAMDASSDAFAADFVLERQPGWAVNLGVARLMAAIDVVWGPMAALSRQVSAVNTEVIANYQALRAGLNGLVRTPRVLADALRTLFALPADLSRAARRDYVAAFAGLWRMGAVLDAPRYGDGVRVLNASQAYGARLVVPGPMLVGVGHVGDSLGVLEPVPGQGVAGVVLCGLGRTWQGRDALAWRQADRLCGVVDQLVETLATAAWVQAVADMPLDNYDESVRLRLALHAQCVRLLGRAGSLGSGAALAAGAVPYHGAVSGLMSAGLRDLAVRSQDMARMDSFTPQGWTPIWQVSYQLYGSTAYVDELMALNPQVEHAMLAPPGRPLRVARHG